MLSGLRQAGDGSRPRLHTGHPAICDQMCRPATMGSSSGSRPRVRPTIGGSMTRTSLACVCLLCALGLVAPATAEAGSYDVVSCVGARSKRSQQQPRSRTPTRSGTTSALSSAAGTSTMPRAPTGWSRARPPSPRPDRRVAHRGRLALRCPSWYRGHPASWTGASPRRATKVATTPPRWTMRLTTGRWTSSTRPAVRSAACSEARPAGTAWAPRCARWERPAVCERSTAC